MEIKVSIGEIVDKLSILLIKKIKKNINLKYKSISLARSVYFTNDKRANVKKRINIEYGSNFIEEKSYNKY